MQQRQKELIVEVSPTYDWVPLHNPTLIMPVPDPNARFVNANQDVVEQSDLARAQRNMMDQLRDALVEPAP